MLMLLFVSLFFHFYVVERDVSKFISYYFPNQGIQEHKEGCDRVESVE